MVTKEEVENIITRDEIRRIASTIRKQISIPTFMEVGARQFTYGTTSKDQVYLSFRVTVPVAKRGGNIQVIYNSDKDLYDIELTRINIRAKDPVKLLTAFRDVSVEKLNEFVKTIGNTGK
jgi:predicted regulator of amino acid metabolism with ACT domain